MVPASDVRGSVPPVSLRTIATACAPSQTIATIGPLVIYLIRYMTSGPIVAMVWEGAHAVAIVRKLTGGTEPLTSDAGTIRGDFVMDSYKMSDDDGRSVRNIVHASGSSKEAEDEIKHWFKPEEVIRYKSIQEKILYDVNLDGILE